MRRD
ncbi:UNVERIFIED_CONTAM: hypothetical protein GTU68_029353 [Idotea baltica]